MSWIKKSLGCLAIEDRQIIPPESIEATRRPYLGLEQIEAGTGKILCYDQNSVEGKSTTFAFDERHVLYGKLRPYLNKVATPERKGRCSTEIIPLLPHDVDRDFLALLLRTNRVVSAAMEDKTGSRMPRANLDALLSLRVVVPDTVEKQRQIAARLKAQLAEVDKARQAAEAQLRETTKLADAIVFDSVWGGTTTKHNLGEVLEEVKRGIGTSWADYPVLGATRSGLAPAKEPPGKKPERYKPVFPGTVFYNPMRILIGSIALVDDDDLPGITSPDYVALRGKEGAVDSRWFYYWLRSPLGERCILSLARGAVRERMLFNRLADGEIELPDFAVQKKASLALAALRPMRRAIESKINDINPLPQKILEQAFRSIDEGDL